VVEVILVLMPLNGNPPPMTKQDRHDHENHHQADAALV
jgi:hypothetical protein